MNYGSGNNIRILTFFGFMTCLFIAQSLGVSMFLLQCCIKPQRETSM